MTPKRLKLTTILGLLVGAALLLLAWTQQWVVLTTQNLTVTADGDVAAPALAALALAGVALAGAIAIASPLFRVILGVSQVALGLTAALHCVLTIANPVAASASAVTAATGIDGDASVAAAVSAASLSAWPWVAFGGAAIATVGGVAILIGGSRWPGSTRRHTVVRFAEASAAPAPLGDWDSLSIGDDPTSDRPDENGIGDWRTPGESDDPASR